MEILGLKITFNIATLLVALICVAIGWVIMSVVSQYVTSKPMEYCMKKMAVFALWDYLFLAIVLCIVTPGMWQTIAIIVTSALAVISALCWMFRKAKQVSKAKRKAATKTKKITVN